MLYVLASHLFPLTWKLPFPTLNSSDGNQYFFFHITRIKRDGAGMDGAGSYVILSVLTFLDVFPSVGGTKSEPR